VTDADGRYTLELVDGTHSLTATAPGYQASAPRLVTVPPDAGEVDFALGQSGFSVSPGSLEVTLNSDQSAVRSLQIHNADSAPLVYSVKPDVELGAAIQAAPDTLFRDDFEPGGLADWTKQGSGTYEVVSNIPAAQGLCSFYMRAETATPRVTACPPARWVRFLKLWSAFRSTCGWSGEILVAARKELKQCQLAASVTWQFPGVAFIISDMGNRSCLGGVVR
jgi:hypothetical protein